MVDNSIGFGSPNFQGQPTWKGWLSFAFGGITTFLLVYVGIARPAADELSLLREQMRSLEKNVALVAGQRDAVDETNHLLSQLSQQQSHANAARKTLVDLRELTSALIAESNRVHEATTAINQLASIKDLLLANAEGVVRAADALTASEELQERLANSATANELALRSSLDLLAIRSELLKNGGNSAEAKSALQDLMQLRSTLDKQGSAIHIAQERANDLIALKDSVISQTSDLGESIETLEITCELNERFHRATSSFKEIRDWMTEMVAMEPTFAQIRRMLEPIADLVNLKRMDPKELRDFARTFVQQSQDRLASKSGNIVSHRVTSEDKSGSPETAADAVIE